jgi:NAD(P)-dependent dehydrogenase (short-subunit alcohol dehydrogenase family)
MGKLEGKTAVILGAASPDNMGQVMARAFAKEGARVMVAGRKEGPLQAIASEIGGEYALCDITSHSDNRALADAAVAKLGRVDAAINCTGWGLLKSFTEITEDELAQAPSGGSLISLSSATTKAVIGNHAAYIGTKTGSEGLIRCVANDYGQYGIKANSISPAFTESPMTTQSFAVPGLVDAFLPRYPLGRLNTSQDVASAAVWLCSDDCFVTGENIQPNGGLTLRGNPQSGDIERSVGAAMAKLQAT